MSNDSRLLQSSQDPVAQFLFSHGMWFLFKSEILDKEDHYFNKVSNIDNSRISKTEFSNSIESIYVYLLTQAFERFQSASYQDNVSHISGEKNIPKVNRVVGALNRCCDLLTFSKSTGTADLILASSDNLQLHIFDFQFNRESIGSKLVLLLQQSVEARLSSTGFNSPSDALKAYLIEYIINLIKDEESWIRQCFFQQTPVEQPSWLMNEFVKLLNFQCVLSENVSDSMSNINQLREQGNNLMKNMSYAQAIKVYTTAIEYNPTMFTSELPQLLTNRAVAFIGLNCVPEAIDDLNLALSLDQTFTPAWTQIGYCHLYMGRGLLALKCYLCALKSSVGEIIPRWSANNEDLVEQYKNNKCKTILPQFIERLNQSIALTEKRSYQQLEPEDEIKKVVSEVRRILAHLRAQGPEDDREYFSYLPLYRDSGLRRMAERANSSRPNILTPEVQQNMLARNGMETATVTQVRAEPFVRTGSRNTAAGATTTTTTTEDNIDSVDQTSPRPVIRDLLNDLGTMFDVPRTAGANVETNRGGTTGTATPGNENPPNAFADSLSEGISGAISEGVRGMIGAFSNNPNVRTFVHEFRSGNSNTQSNRNNSSNTPPDVDMREPPSDLD